MLKKIRKMAKKKVAINQFMLLALIIVAVGLSAFTTFAGYATPYSTAYTKLHTPPYTKPYTPPYTKPYTPPYTKPACPYNTTYSLPCNPVLYDYQLVSIASYRSVLSPGETISVSIQLKNTGVYPWSKNVRLGTGSIYGAKNQPRDYMSEFADSSWGSQNRAAVVTPVGVRSGSIGTFNFKIKAPQKPGIYQAFFTPVVDGVTWMRDTGIYWWIKVEAPKPLPKTTNFQIITTGSNYLTMAWDQSVDATRYEIKRSTSKNGPWTTVANMPSGSYKNYVVKKFLGSTKIMKQFTNTGLLSGTTYYYTVKYYIANGRSSDLSDTISKKTSGRSSTGPR